MKEERSDFLDIRRLGLVDHDGNGANHGGGVHVRLMRFQLVPHAMKEKWIVILGQAIDLVQVLSGDYPKGSMHLLRAEGSEFLWNLFSPRLVLMSFVQEVMHHGGDPQGMIIDGKLCSKISVFF